MVNPGVFLGIRKEFMLGEREAYSKGVAGGYAKDAIATIQRRYLKRFPMSLPHDEEPSGETVEAVDDDVADPEPVVPDEAALSPEAYATEMKAVSERVKLLNSRKGQISRWLQYQHMKADNIDLKDSGLDQPFKQLFQQLTGGSTFRPRQQPPANFWRKTNRPLIDAEVTRRKNLQQLEKKQLAALREKVVKELFTALSTDEKDDWKKAAKEDHEALVKKWESERKAPLSSVPEDRQRCIQGLTQFMKPILDLICDATGWKATFVAGGPEPAHGGRLSMLSVHSGTTTGEVKMNFGRCEQARYQAEFVPMFSSFLRKSFSPEECRARAIPDREFDSIVNLGVESAEVNLLDDVIPIHNTDEPTVYPTPSSSGLSPTSSGEGSDEDCDGHSTRPSTNLTPIDRSPSVPSVSLPTVQSPLLSLPNPSPLNLVAPPSTPPAIRSVPLSPTRSAPPSPTRSVPLSPTRSAPPSPTRSGPPSPTRSAPPSPTRSAPPSPTRSAPLSPTRSVPPSPTLRPVLPIGVNPPSLIIPEVPSEAASRVPVPSTSTSLTLAGREHTAPKSTLISTQTATPRSTTPQPKAVAQIPATSDPSKDISMSHQPNPITRKRKDIDTSPSVDSSPDARPPSKRLRTTSQKDPSGSRNPLAPSGHASSTSIASPSATSEVCTPDWYDNVMQIFSSNEIGMPWSSLLEHWTAFEVIHSFKEVQRFTPKSRPDAVTQWIKSGRRIAWRPHPIGAKTFEKQFKTWWTQAQPSWRVRNGVLDASRVSGDWEHLRRPGENGMVSVVAALFFWALNLNGTALKDVGWLAAVEDVTSALQFLSSLPSNSQ